MIERYEYRGHPVVITDDLPFGYPDGTWIISGSARGWLVLFSGENSGVHLFGSQEPSACVADARLELERLVDAEILQWQRMEADDAEQAAALAIRADTLNARPYRLHGGCDQVSIEAPIALLLAAHNALPHDHLLREQVREHLKSQASARPAIAGLWVDREGNLAFDDQRAIAETHRRKMMRNAESLRQRMKDVMQDLAGVLGHDAEERAIGAVGTVNTLVPLTELTPIANALTSVGTPLFEPLATLAKAAGDGTEL